MSSSKNLVVVVRLRSSDGDAFEVEEEVALQSQTIKRLLEQDCTIHNGIPLTNVTTHILAKVIEYCRKHAEIQDGDAAATAASLKEWDDKFLDVDQATFCDLMLASSAKYLDIKSLRELTCQKAADMIQGMTVEEIRKIFNVKTCFTPQEIRRNNMWAFE